MELKGERRNGTRAEKQREKEREREKEKKRESEREGKEIERERGWERVGNPVPPGECRSNVVDHE